MAYFVGCQSSKRVKIVVSAFSYSFVVSGQSSVRKGDVGKLSEL